MLKYLVLDTCNLRRLVGKNQVSKTLLQLQLWVEQKKVVLLVPSTLHEEWEKHKEEERNRVLEAIKKWREDVAKRKTIDHPSAYIEEEHYEDLKAKLFSQFRIIDDLITDFAVNIEVSETMKQKVEHAKMNNKAPFHKTKKDNRKDAEILFSSADFITSNGEKKLAFISGNHKDFGASRQNKESLHADIKELFSEVDFDYYTDIYPWIQQQIKAGWPAYRQTARDARRVEYLIRVDKNAPLLDQIHQYLTRRFGDISILPKKLFTEHYPFITAKHFNNYHRPFTLVTDNKELFDLMTSITITPDKVTSTTDGVIKSKEDEEKAREIFCRLAHNFLHYIAYQLEEQGLLKYEEERKSCSCDLCQFYAFRFDVLADKNIKAIDDLPDESPGDAMKTAYVQYKLHNYVTAAKIFYQLFERHTEKDLIYYILAYNCKQLGWLISQTLWKDQSVISWGKSLADIDLPEIYKSCRNALDDQILQWLHQEQFYKESIAKAYQYNHKIREIQQSKSNGYNTGTRKMQEVFLVNQAFLDRNCLVYDTYGTYQPMYELFAEGLVSSLQWSGGMGGRLAHMNDDLLRPLIISGKHEWIRKLYYRSKLEVLPYNRTAPPELQIEKVSEYLLDAVPHFVGVDTDEQSDVQFSMFDGIKEKTLAAITLLATMETGTVAVTSIINKLIALLSHEKLSNDFHVSETFEFLLERKSKILPEELIRKLLMHGIKQKSLLQKERIVDILVYALETTGRELLLTDEEFQVLQHELIDKLTGDSENDPVDMLSTLFGVLPLQQQHVVGSAVAAVLTATFDADRFYMAAMIDMIPVDHTLTQQYLEELDRHALIPRRQHWFGIRQWYTDRTIDHLLNFCFKFNITIPEALRVRIAAVGSYYQWLLDPDNYDYQEFNIEWLSHHFTKYYKRWFRKSEKLKAFVWDAIEKNRMKDAYRTFSKIYAWND